MNTPRSTPSVWPVYVAAVIVALHGGFLSVSSLGILAVFVAGAIFGADLPAGMRGVHTVVTLIALRRFAYGLFGLLTTIGLVRLRAWGWWCAVLWTAIGAYHGIVSIIGLVRLPPPPVAIFVIFGVPAVVAIALVIWTLATRRQLFFPPKPEGAE